MKINIENLGDLPVHIVVDGDTESETILEANASSDFEGGVIELRDLADEADDTDQLATDE